MESFTRSGHVLLCRRRDGRKGGVDVCTSTTTFCAELLPLTYEFLLSFFLLLLLLSLAVYDLLRHRGQEKKIAIWIMRTWEKDLVVPLKTMGNFETMIQYRGNTYMVEGRYRGGDVNVCVSQSFPFLVWFPPVSYRSVRYQTI